MAEEIATENGRISNFEALGTLTLTLDRVLLYTVLHHSLTATHTPNVIEIKETFRGWMDAHTYVRMDGHLRPALLGQLCRRVDPTRSDL